MLGGSDPTPITKTAPNMSTYHLEEIDTVVHLAELIIVNSRSSSLTAEPDIVLKISVLLDS